jgi:opacity protein-like surface antigen
MADPPDTPIFGISELKLGALYHDPPYLWSNFSVERPTADANFEVLFAPWAYTFGGYLRPAIGTSVNFIGGTSKAYADMRWEIEAPSGVFFALGMGAAIHNGELSPVDNDHKALGSRVLFHPSAELGYRFDGVNSVSIFADHVSNGFTQRYNEGLDTIGIRYGRRLGPIVAPETNGWEPVLPAAVFSGFYVGAFVGYQIETVDWFTASPIRSSRSGFAEGGYAGYSWQSGKGIFGIEVDASPARRNFSAGCDVGGVYCVTQVSGVYSARARFGWVIDNGMIYGTAGVALTPWDASVLNAASQRLDQATGVNTGVAVGAGLEYKLGASLAVRGEVLHNGMFGWGLDLPTAGPTSNQFQNTIGRVGISWYFR